MVDFKFLPTFEHRACTKLYLLIRITDSVIARVCRYSDCQPGFRGFCANKYQIYLFLHILLLRVPQNKVVRQARVRTPKGCREPKMLKSLSTSKYFTVAEFLSTKKYYQ